MVRIDKIINPLSVLYTVVDVATGYSFGCGCREWALDAWRRADAEAVEDGEEPSQPPPQEVGAHRVVVDILRFQGDVDYDWTAPYPGGHGELVKRYNELVTVLGRDE